MVIYRNIYSYVHFLDITKKALNIRALSKIFMDVGGKRAPILYLYPSKEKNQNKIINLI